MKSMTCEQLGGPCALAHTGETADDVIRRLVEEKGWREFLDVAASAGLMGRVTEKVIANARPHLRRLAVLGLPDGFRFRINMEPEATERTWRDEIIGNNVRVKVVKNKCAPPFRQAEFDILYNEGISTEGDLLDLGVETGLVEKSGSWFSYDGERIGQGREQARKFLKENREVFHRLGDAGGIAEMQFHAGAA